MFVYVKRISYLLNSVQIRSLTQDSDSDYYVEYTYYKDRWKRENNTLNIAFSMDIKSGVHELEIKKVLTSTLTDPPGTRM